MRRHRIQPRQSLLSRTDGPVRIPPISALILCLILAASLLQACALAPVVMVATATTAALLVEAEKAITKSVVMVAEKERSVRIITVSSAKGAFVKPVVGILDGLNFFCCCFGFVGR